MATSVFSLGIHAFIAFFSKIIPDGSKYKIKGNTSYFLRKKQMKHTHENQNMIHWNVCFN